MDRKAEKVKENSQRKDRYDPNGGELIDSEEEGDSWSYKLSGSQECL